MNNIVILSIIIMGSIFNIVYVFKSLSLKNKTDLPCIINMYLVSSGIIAGIILFFCPFFPELKKNVSEFDLYVALSGISILYVSIIDLSKRFSFIFSKESGFNQTANYKEEL